jgi:rhodanese-related sulfurtransferase
MEIFILSAKSINLRNLRSIVCYRQTGARSASAVALHLKNGLSAANLRGGIAEWNFYKLVK